MGLLAGVAAEKQAHVVCIPVPVQSHIKAMLKMAKLLHSKGVFITFVNTEFNHRRILKSGGLQFLQGLTGFEFETIPDGLPPSDPDATQDILALCQSVAEYMSQPFQNLLTKLNTGKNQVTSILSDGFMTFSADAAQNLGVPIVSLWTVAACGFMGFYQFKNVLERGLVPLKDESYLTNGYLDTMIDWIPGMPDMRLADLPSHLRITDPSDFQFNFFSDCTQRAANCTALVIHTFDDLEQELVNVISSMLGKNVYTIGPQQMLLKQSTLDQKKPLTSIGSLWEEEKTCLEWLDSKEADSVVYVNFGSITVLSPEQLLEFGWGLANSKFSFLWIIRPDLIINGESANTLGLEFMDAIKDRGFISSWCPQEDVLNHVAVGGFLTHGGWNSILESLSAGVPMLCWPFFGDQTINCKFLRDKWECGLEIPNNVKRGDVEELVRLLMEGVEGKKMRNKAMEWKKLAEKACGPNGSSSLNLDKLVVVLKN
ncbi:hypothetical protein DCAR_0206639 [Daucus carota subsp. sativus]|uniref:Glycosyltransferase n=2 Tax=Daucus carota subsp. sativus TaxID=79200 RepID=A0AAF0WG35_DAUCS|nr:PREDICTED: 7-deoxyloganetin glucosyltransferase-like [Daucus carota subsp. sativus]WOG87415.1 hypothetical protein DCAR_0206639 [Daucus carota subsp. sativus]